jgi:hypothetical protein
MASAKKMRKKDRKLGDSIPIAVSPPSLPPKANFSDLAVRLILYVVCYC